MYNGRCNWFVAIFVIGQNVFSQQTYFQQEVNYKIDVRLNDKDHTLKAFEEIQYINNASTSLNYIYFHLWPNAYKNNNTALAKQLINLKNTALYFSKEEERGYIDSLDFKVNGKQVQLEFDDENPDICKLILNEPLRSLDTIKITTPFFVKIPDAKFSRLGHDQQAYYITQWYPKPAVYDNEGWHPMPYLDQGEFYSEYGAFDVSITLPQNYVLNATGDRIDADEEEDFLNNNVAQTLRRIDEGGNFPYSEMAFPPSSSKFKTVRFKQYRVHDFAWFADKRFHVIHDQIQLPNTNRTVDTWVYFTSKKWYLWKDAIDYVNESTIFYSYMLGDYPYNNVSAVDGVIMAGGGMEYPNVTVIGDMSSALDLDVTITHEVGHNWFYGILGSNERTNPGLDEGINSFYEMSYVRAKYPEKKLSDYVGFDTTRRFLGLNKYAYWREKEVAYFLSAKSNYDQPINTSSELLSSFNYGSIIYSKTPVILDYLRDYMGDESFNKAMQFYFENYKFKHPQPKDLLQTLQYFSGSDLTWFSKYLMQSTEKIDYKIKSVNRNKDGSYRIKVKNKSKLPVPFNIYGYKDGKPVGFVWFNGSDSTRKLGFPPSDVDCFKIDGLDMMPDINRRNNFSRTRGIFKKVKPLQLNFLTKLPDPSKNQINYLPIGGYNLYNGFMLGAAIHDQTIYDKKVEYVLAPMYAFKSKTLTGFAELNFNFFPKNVFRKVTLGTNARSFAYNTIDERNLSFVGTDLFLNYLRVSPSLQMEFQNKNKTSHATHVLKLSYHTIIKEELNVGMVYNQDTYNLIKRVGSNITMLTYDLTDKRVINPYSLQASVQHDGYMTKASATFKENFTISKNKSVEVRVFAGTFIRGNAEQNGPYRFRMSGYRGDQDYLYEANYLGRSEYNGLAFSQFTDVEGAFKVWTPLGQSATYLIAANIKSPTIWKLPFKVFADIGTAEKVSLNKENILWDAGLNVTLVKDMVDVYLPLLYSNDIKETLTLNNVSFMNTIRFTFNIHKLKPKEMLINSFL